MQAGYTASVAAVSVQQRQQQHQLTQPQHEFRPESIAEMHETKAELILKVQALKRELADWRGRVDGQVTRYRGELADLQVGGCSGDPCSGCPG